jgi:hypothetical protein
MTWNPTPGRSRRWRGRRFPGRKGSRVPVGAFDDRGDQPAAASLPLVFGPNSPDLPPWAAGLLPGAAAHCTLRVESLEEREPSHGVAHPGICELDQRR